MEQVQDAPTNVADAAHPNDVRGPIEERFNGDRAIIEAQYVKDKTDLETQYQKDLELNEAKKQQALVDAGFNPDGSLVSSNEPPEDYDEPFARYSRTEEPVSESTPASSPTPAEVESTPETAPTEPTPTPETPVTEPTPPHEPTPSEPVTEPTGPTPEEPVPPAPSTEQTKTKYV